MVSKCLAAAACVPQTRRPGQGRPTLPLPCVHFGGIDVCGLWPSCFPRARQRTNARLEEGGHGRCLSRRGCRPRGPVCKWGLPTLLYAASSPRSLTHAGRLGDKRRVSLPSGQISKLRLRVKARACAPAEVEGDLESGLHVCGSPALNPTPGSWGNGQPRPGMQCGSQFEKYMGDGLLGWGSRKCR